MRGIDNMQKIAVGILFLISVTFSVLMIHFTFFASQGARYTWDDGVQDRQVNLERYNELKQTADNDRKINLERYNELKAQIERLK